MERSGLSNRNAKQKKVSKDCGKSTLLNNYLKVKHTSIYRQWFLIKVWD